MNLGKSQKEKNCFGCLVWDKGIDSVFVLPLLTNSTQAPMEWTVKLHKRVPYLQQLPVWQNSAAKRQNGEILPTTIWRIVCHMITDQKFNVANLLLDKNCEDYSQVFGSIKLSFFHVHAGYRAIPAYTLL
jgi:hypothetical protein